MRLTSLRRVAVPATLAVAVGLLTACGGSSDSSSSSTKASSSSSSEAAPSSSSSAAEESSAPAAAGGDDCLIGSWEADTSGLTAQMQALMGDALAGSTINATGSLVTTFDGTTSSAAYNNFALAFNVSQSGVDMVMNLGFNGTATTTYTATGGQLTLGSMDMSKVAVTYTAKVGDQTMDMSDQLGDSMNGVGTTAGTSSAYTCDATTLTTTTSASGKQFTQTYKRK